MSRKDYLYRVFHYLRHWLSARNSGGGGIHSPYLFEWVRMIMRDKNSYYVWRDIECIREQMLQNNSELEYIDWGAGAHVKGENRGTSPVFYGAGSGARALIWRR